MTNKLKSGQLFTEYIEAFRCPHCYNPMKVMNSKSLICTNNHTFDFAKQGYVNLMTRPSKSQYDNQLFEARARIITETDLYSLLHKKISEVMKEQMTQLNHPLLIVDAGCGEGSHLQRIIEESGDKSVMGVGLDISKEGILMAAKKYKEQMWIVADLAKSPLENQSFQAIVNILSPSNYHEFKRILVPNGLVVKVVPRANYLKELREALFEETNKKTYRNDETVELFKKHFHLKDVIPLCYTKRLEQAELRNLVQMTPLSWSAKHDSIEKFLNQSSLEITVDLDILIGLNG